MTHKNRRMDERNQFGIASHDFNLKITSAVSIMRKGAEKSTVVFLEDLRGNVVDVASRRCLHRSARLERDGGLIVQAGSEKFTINRHV